MQRTLYAKHAILRKGSSKELSRAQAETTETVISSRGNTKVPVRDLAYSTLRERELLLARQKRSRKHLLPAVNASCMIRKIPVRDAIRCKNSQTIHSPWKRIRLIGARIFEKHFMAWNHTTIESTLCRRKFMVNETPVINGCRTLTPIRGASKQSNCQFLVNVVKLQPWISILSNNASPGQLNGSINHASYDTDVNDRSNDIKCKWRISYCIPNKGPLSLETLE
ncbi:hypothetical protein C8R48DRAFT_673079 [Suillus tomentosus]|nr:hypothetical protein C8R48DRAFT_673079 [Suillus tomentosus]